MKIMFLVENVNLHQSKLLFNRFLSNYVILCQIMRPLDEIM
jgi:hypothetical protein